ncbi:hypothetical protein ACFL1R_10470 [Candidatus Latescibacterota bacterium]
MVHKATQSYWMKLLTSFLFAAAMAYIEAVVVVYLRELYYPEGFSFPLRLVPVKIIIIELFREIATLVMLATVAVFAGRKFWERFGYFIILFGIWDIFYYIWLKITLDWPSSLFEPDILFLIPLPWIGPVIAPLLIAALMITVGISITYLFHKGNDFRPTYVSWSLAITGIIIILYSFMRDSDAWLYQTMPKPYGYWQLAAGLILLSSAYLHIWIKVMKETKS